MVMLVKQTPLSGDRTPPPKKSHQTAACGQIIFGPQKQAKLK